MISVSKACPGVGKLAAASANPAEVVINGSCATTLTR
jgi:hypothetical protein